MAADKRFLSVERVVSTQELVKAVRRRRFWSTA